ncbi:hypothetical protein [Dyadobacter sp. CY326]|uniref:hypothetical protein n=1 Tax=Dyadobacter sp. CY326 TaxID=2907300 RepID=UPI001F2C66C2|nr:hypothetical protein [Dyadobacter sp. CY326]
MKRLYIKSSTQLSCLLLVICLSLSACDKAGTVDNEPKVYYDLKGFIDNQITYLNEIKPKVAKKVTLNGKEESQQETQIDWKKELELFAQADINKPAYAKSYTVTKSDSSVFEYKLKAGENLPVRYLMIKVDSATQQPVRVKAIVQSENRIYKSQRNIELACTRKNNLVEVSSYTIQGYQKLVLMDAKTFNVTAKIGL